MGNWPTLYINPNRNCELFIPVLIGQVKNFEISMLSINWSILVQTATEYYIFFTVWKPLNEIKLFQEISEKLWEMLGTVNSYFESDVNWITIEMDRMTHLCAAQ